MAIEIEIVRLIRLISTIASNNLDRCTSGNRPASQGIS